MTKRLRKSTLTDNHARQIALTKTLKFMLLLLFSHHVVSDSFVTPCTLAHQSPLHRIFQAIILKWVVVSFPRGSSQLRDWTCVSCVGLWTLYHWAVRGSPLLESVMAPKGWILGKVQRIYYGLILMGFWNRKGKKKRIMEMYKNKILWNKFLTCRRNDIYLIFERETKNAEQFSGA